MATHIQIHRSAIGGATPDVGNMLEGEVAVNLTDKKFYIKGATGELITLIDGVSGERVAGADTQIQYNTDGNFNAASDFVFNETSNRLGVGTSTPRSSIETSGVVMASGFSGATGIFSGPYNGITAVNFWGPDTNTFIHAKNTKMITMRSNAATTLNPDGLDIDTAMNGNNFSNLFYANAGTNKIGIGTSAPTQALHVLGNVRASGGFVGVTGNFTGAVTVLDKVGIETLFPRESLEVSGTVLAAGISADGATFGGDVNFLGNLLLPEDGEIGIGGDTEKIVFNGTGSGSSSIDIKCSNVDFGLGSGSNLRSHGDEDTYIKFANDLHGSGNDGIQLFQSNNLMVDVTPTDVSVAGCSFGIAGGATFGGDVILTNTGDIALTIKADTDNSGENDNPLIRMSQDGTAVNFDAGIIGDTGQIVTGSLGNHAFLNTTYVGSGVQIATDDIVRMTISDGDAAGRIGIGTNAPRESLEVHGNIMTNNGVSGATFSVGSHIEFPNGTTLGGTQQDIIGISLRTGNQNFLTTGNKGIRIIPYDCVVTAWTLYAPSNGSIQFDINSGAHGNWPNLTSVGGSSLPSLSNQSSARDASVNWAKTTFFASDIIEFEVDSVSGVTACTLNLHIRRTGE